ncbi:MAG: DUF177 domain-containing protein [bacterium]|nr:DUF177 domain-containing protein [bacterium]MCM1376253.1 DUF177 domain-containing protein [Muribaculum sp.]
MFILLSDVFTFEGRRLETEAELEMTAFDNGTERFTIVRKTPVTFVITHLETGKALVEAGLQLTIEAACDRCLTEVPVKMELHAEQTVFSPDWGTEEDRDDQDFMEGYELDVDAFVHDMIIGNWPVKILCREDCRGICPVCGQNRNVRECGCDSFVPDPRMAVIQDIFNANKEV